MRVLLVEDERHLVETIKRGLTDHGFVVDVVRGNAPWQLSRQLSPCRCS